MAEGSTATRAEAAGTPARRPAGEARTPLSLAWRQYRLERKMFWRNPSAAFFNFMLPLLLLGLFGALFRGDSKNLDVIVPGIAGMGVMASTFSALAFNLTFLREQGVLKRMRGTPMPSSSYLAGLLGNAVANATIQIAIVVLVARFAFGVGWPKNWLELAVFLGFGVATFGALGVAFSHVIPNFDSAPAYVNAVFLPVLFISGVFYDTAGSPEVLNTIARVLPLTHLIDGLSAAMVTGEPLSTQLGALAVLAAWGLFGAFFAVRGFEWDERA
jgi:ABC-2 type transport system permease protein